MVTVATRVTVLTTAPLSRARAVFERLGLKATCSQESRWFRWEALGDAELEVDLVESPALSAWQRLRRAPSVGVLVGVGSSPRVQPWKAAAAVAVGRALFPDVDVSKPFSSTSLREVAVSSTGFENTAPTLPSSSVPGVARVGSLDLRLQPLRRGATALVFRCRDVADAARDLKKSGLAFDRVGTSGSLAGQIVLAAPWAHGLEIRLCQRDHPHAQFYERHHALTDAPDVIPELQSPHLLGAASAPPSHPLTAAPQPFGDCWMEARAMLKRPSRFL